MQSFEQVVRQQRVLGHQVFERGHEGVNVVQPLAGEAAFTEQVLVRIRHRGGVGIDPGMAGIQAREERPRRARIGHADAGLKDAVPVGDTANARIDAGPIERMRNDTDQLAGRVTR